MILEADISKTQKQRLRGEQKKRKGDKEEKRETYKERKKDNEIKKEVKKRTRSQNITKISDQGSDQEIKLKQN